MRKQFIDNLRVWVRKLTGRVDELEKKPTGMSVITSTSTQTVEGLVLPVLTSEDVLKAYNAVSAGQGCVIDSNNGMEQFVVTQGDTVDGGVYIMFNHYGTHWVQYDEDGSVTVSLSAPISHETWTFTLEDDTTVTKEVVLWTSQE